MVNVKPKKVNNKTVTLTFLVTEREDKLTDTEIIYLASRHYNNPNYLINFNVNGGEVNHRDGKNGKGKFVQVIINTPPVPRPQDMTF